MIKRILLAFALAAQAQAQPTTLPATATTDGKTVTVTITLPSTQPTPPQPQPSPAPTISVSPASIAFTKVVGAPNPAAKSFNITVPPGVRWSTADTIQFADASPTTSGTGPGTVTMTPSAGMTNALPGTYTDKITVSATGLASVTVPVTLTVTPAQPQPQPQPDPGDRVLVPGSGFGGATPQPPQQGTGPAANEKAIARWDVIPFQTVDSELNVGVVAFHLSGIDRVEFFLSGGPATKITTAANNPHTGVVEYFATLRASALAKDGPVEMRAVVYPKIGVPRVLESLQLSTNGKGTLPKLVRYVSPTGNDNNNGLTPQTAVKRPNKAARLIQDAQGGSADGGTIYMLPGSYAITGPSFSEESRTQSRWLTLTAAPGVNRNQVTITSASGSAMYNRLVRFQNVTITGNIESGGPLEDFGWIDNCLVDAGNRNSGLAGLSVSQWSKRFVTDSTYSNLGIVLNSHHFIRGVLVEHVGGDVFSNSDLVINSTIRDFEQAPGAHSDVYQATGFASNVILYGVDASAVGSVNSNLAFEAGCDGFAVIDCKLATRGPYVMYLSNALKNLYIKNTPFSGRFAVLGTLSATNVVFDSCTFTNNPGPLAGVTYR